MMVACVQTLRRAAWAGVFTVLVLLISGCQTVNSTKLFLPASWVGLEQVGADVRVEASATPSQRVRALELRGAAFQQLVAVTGTVQSHPTHVFCFTDACYQRLGGGTPRAKAFGDMRTLIGPAGLTSAYLAHEWWHVELYHRVGYRVVRKLPRWFDEGVAVWISDDPRYGEAMYQRILAQGITPPALVDLKTMDNFIEAIGRYGDHLWASKPADAVTVVYPTAAHEVRRWMAIVGTQGLLELIDGLHRGETFEALYSMLEQQHKSQSH